MSGRPLRRLSLVLALCIGGGAAYLALPWCRTQLALSAIISPDADRRQRAWDWLGYPALTSHKPRGAAHLERIGRTLARGDDASLIDAAAALRAAWWWDNLPASVMLRAGILRTATDEDSLIVANEMMQCPLGLAEDDVRGVFETLLGHASPAVRTRGFEAACAWAGRQRGTFLAGLALPADAAELERRRFLALSWCDPPVHPPPIDPMAPVEVFEAVLFAHARSDGGDVSTMLDLARDWTGAPRPALAYVLRHCADARAHDALQRLAAMGSKSATYASQARSRGADDAQSRRVALDPAQDPRSRRLAAWRLDRMSEEVVLDILAADPREPDDSVFAAALLAERRLAPSRSSELAASWIGHLDDDFKRAGALLAALRREHLGLLQARFEIEDIAAVRTAQALALHAAGRPTGTTEFRELAYRALHKPDGDFNPDTALCMLLADEHGALELLTSRPSGEGRQSVQQRSWLIERFAPAWFTDLGRPIGGDQAALYLHFDALDARRMLEQRR